MADWSIQENIAVVGGWGVARYLESQKIWILVLTLAPRDFEQFSWPPGASAFSFVKQEH